MRYINCPDTCLGPYIIFFTKFTYNYSNDTNTAIKIIMSFDDRTELP